MVNGLDSDERCLILYDVSLVVLGAGDQRWISATDECTCTVYIRLSVFSD
jgi:hypothetical protein